MDYGFIKFYDIYRWMMDLYNFMYVYIIIGYG